jgi:hypothetical protein
LSGTPALSVVIPSPRGLPGAARTLAALARQERAEQLEVLVAAPAGAPAAALRTVEVPREAAASVAYAAGVLAASASFVAFGEDHSFPQPGWATALLAGLARGHSAVGPAVRNANPINGVSWADFRIGYGPWAESIAGGEVGLLPGHNSAYRRDLLLALGDGLEEALRAEAVLHWRWRAEGRTLWLEPQAVTAHTNFGRWRVFCRVQPLTGRVFAGSRAAEWGLGRRLAWAAAFPAIAGVRIARTLRRAAPDRGRAPWTAAFAVVGGLVFDAVGQGIGYLFGAGGAVAALRDYEHARERFSGVPADG